MHNNVLIDNTFENVNGRSHISLSSSSRNGRVYNYRTITLRGDFHLRWRCKRFLSNALNIEQKDNDIDIEEIDLY